ncbi:MAG: cob(I)yrinic acid a,c-diamide adenosyltransferase [Lachnospiraceae bacterium]|nr:cob(I)yrinic acid a,c-diamide adenosyltransferase [Lachnospiraceae bacterium]
MKIYTKSGDRMTTGLLDGTRVSKHDGRIHLLGNIDELNSMLGVVKSLTGEQARKEELSGIQRTLMRMMSGIAESQEVEATHAFCGKYHVEEESVAHLEAEIDRMEAAFDREKDFVLPGGSFYSAQIDVARTVARRCERWFSQVMEDYPLDAEAARYLNRLSDYLYVLARYADASEQDKTQQLPGTEAVVPGALTEKRKGSISAEEAQKAVHCLHKKLNNSYGTYYTFCVCDAEGRQLATNARERHSVAVSEALRAATDALARAARARAGAGLAVEPGQAGTPAPAAAPEDGGAALYAAGQLAGAVGVYGSYKKDVNEKAQMLLDLLGSL